MLSILAMHDGSRFASRANTATPLFTIENTLGAKATAAGMLLNRGCILLEATDCMNGEAHGVKHVCVHACAFVRLCLEHVARPRCLPYVCTPVLVHSGHRLNTHIAGRRPPSPTVCPACNMTCPKKLRMAVGRTVCFEDGYESASTCGKTSRALCVTVLPVQIGASPLPRCEAPLD